MGCYVVVVVAAAAVVVVVVILVLAVEEKEQQRANTSLITIMGSILQYSYDVTMCQQYK